MYKINDLCSVVAGILGHDKMYLVIVDQLGNKGKYPVREHFGEQIEVNV